MIPLTRALTRTISRSLERCELVHLARRPMDMQLAVQQHLNYLEALRSDGMEVTVLPEEPELADAAFVEDTAVILDELAVVCRPGCPSRRPEAASIADALQKFRELAWLEPPGTLEGGDVLVLGKKIWAGLSTRTNREGVRQLEDFAKPHGYKVIPVAVRHCLHLKTAVTPVAASAVVANPQWVDLELFADLDVLTVPSEEPWGANTLSTKTVVWVPNSCPATAGLLRARGLSIRTLDISELQKAEAGLTCLSLLYRDGGAR